MEVKIMPAKKNTKLPKPTKKAASKKIIAIAKNPTSIPLKESFKGWKDSQKVTLTLTDFEAILDGAFEEINNKVWIDRLIPIIAKLDSISAELTKLINEQMHEDIHTKYTEYDKIKHSIVTHINWIE
jgi:hypothetical protein